LAERSIYTETIVVHSQGHPCATTQSICGSPLNLQEYLVGKQE
jgi:hypothetical protein